MQISEPKKGYKFVDVGFGKVEEIPEEWEILTFKDIQDNDHKYPIGDGDHGKITPASYQTHGIPFIRVGDIVADKIISNKLIYISKDIHKDNPKNHLFPDDIIIAKTGATIGKVAIIPKWIETANTTSSIGKITVNKKKVIPQFFYYYIISAKFQKMMRTVSIKSAQPGFNINDIKKFTILLPSFLEQQKITSILSNVDETIEKTNQLIQKTQIHQKGLMQKLFTKGIGHTKFKKVDWLFEKQIEIPDKWNIQQLEKGLSLIQYGLSSSFSKNGKYAIFRMNNIHNGYIIENDLRYIQLDLDEFKKFKLEKNDLLFNRTNSIDHIGKIGIYQLDGLHTFASYLIRLRTNDEILDSKFLNFLFNYDKFKNMIKNLATPSVNQSNINATNLKKFLIPIPPLDEQKQIASILSNVDSQINKEKLHKSNLESLKKGLMQKLLTGQIRVKV